MPVKSTAPYTGPPSWLDPSAEVPMRAERFSGRGDFCTSTMRDLLALRLTPAQAAEVAANVAVETGWGANWYCGNGGGWKITRSYADAFKRREGHAAPWFKARGNVTSADAAWCFYRVFDSRAAFMRTWVERFLPRSVEGAPAPPSGQSADYRATGAAFWRGDAAWFAEMILAGYKGAPSRRRLLDLRARGEDDAVHPSLRDHAAIARYVLVCWAQQRLGVDPDGAWGPKSREAMRHWQSARGLPPTSDLDAATASMLVS